MGCDCSKVYLQYGLTSNLKLETLSVDQLDYHTLLTSQVEALEFTDKMCILEVGTTLPPNLAHS